MKVSRRSVNPSRRVSDSDDDPPPLSSPIHSRSRSPPYLSIALIILVLNSLFHLSCHVISISVMNVDWNLGFFRESSFSLVIFVLVEVITFLCSIFASFCSLISLEHVYTIIDLVWQNGWRSNSFNYHTLYLFRRYFFHSSS